MIKAILFDLDGTLLPIETEAFLKKYMHELSAKFSHLLTPKDFINHLFYATDKVIKNNDPHKTNKEIFWFCFTEQIGEEKVQEIIPIIDEFYKYDFKKLGEDIVPNPQVPQIIEKCKNDGYTLVLATNPIFPMSAICDRIRWTSLKPEDFNLITAYENMHFCKPNLNYYREIAEKINIKPENCLVVGNDMEEDIIAGKLGMKTFLVNDFIINQNKIEVDYDFSGKLTDLSECLQKLSSI